MGKSLVFVPVTIFFLLCIVTAASALTISDSFYAEDMRSTGAIAGEDVYISSFDSTLEYTNRLLSLSVVNDFTIRVTFDNGIGNPLFGLDLSSITHGAGISNVTFVYDFSKFTDVSFEHSFTTDSISLFWGRETHYDSIENGATVDIILSPTLSPAPVPEPATILLLGGGLAGLAFYRRKKK